jgi:hypothetical protein
MYTEEWKKIKTKVPGDLWEKVEDLGFDSPNTAVITALEKLICEPELKRSGKEQEIKIQELGNRLEEEQKRTLELQRELEIKVEETQKQIKDLEKNIEKAERREIYLEEIHNNYMLQVQTLIKQKHILAPGENKPWWRFW